MKNWLFFLVLLFFGDFGVVRRWSLRHAFFPLSIHTDSSSPFCYLHSESWSSLFAFALCSRHALDDELNMRFIKMKLSLNSGDIRWWFSPALSLIAVPGNFLLWRSLPKMCPCECESSSTYRRIWWFSQPIIWEVGDSGPIPITISETVHIALKLQRGYSNSHCPDIRIPTPKRKTTMHFAWWWWGLQNNLTVKEYLHLNIDPWKNKLSNNCVVCI